MGCESHMMWGALRKTFGSLKSILEHRLVEDRVTMATTGINTSWLGAHPWGWKLCLSPSLGWTFKFAFSKYHVPLKGFVVPRDCLETQEVFLENHQPWIRLLSQGPSAPPVHMTSSSGVHLRPQLARIVPDYPGSIVSSPAGVLLACWLTSHSTSRISLMCIRGEDHGHFCSLPSHRETHRDPQTLGADVDPAFVMLGEDADPRPLFPVCSSVDQYPSKGESVSQHREVWHIPLSPQDRYVSPSKRLYRIHNTSHPKSHLQALSLIVLKANQPEPVWTPGS